MLLLLKARFLPLKSDEKPQFVHFLILCLVKFYVFDIWTHCLYPENKRFISAKFPYRVFFMPPLMFHHFSGHLPRTRKLCKFCKMMDQNFQTNRINPAKKILVICLGKTVFPLTLPKHFHFCRNCQTDCFHFQQFLPMLDIFSYMFPIFISSEGALYVILPYDYQAAAPTFWTHTGP